MTREAGNEEADRPTAGARPIARILVVGAGACPLLSLTRASDPASDIDAAADALLEHLMFDGGFEHSSAVVSSSLDMIERLAWLYEPRPDITLRVLYYSGHAVMLSSQEVALAFPDSTYRNPSTLISTGLLNQYLASCPLSEHVWIMDCCFAQGLSFKRLPEVVQGMLHHLVIASSSGYMSSIGSRDISPFTEVFTLGVRGLAYAPDDALLDVSALMEFLEAETERRRLPQPYVHFSGSAATVKFQASPPQQISANIDLLLNLARRPRRGELVVGLGETSDRTKAFAVGSDGSQPSRVWNLDGRTPTMLGMSKTAAGFSRKADIPLVIEDAGTDEVWEEALASRPGRLVVATAVSQGAVPRFVAREVEIHNTPPPTEAEAEGLLTSANLAPGLPDLSVEGILHAANGSMLNLERVVRSSVFLRRHGDDLPPQNVTVLHTITALAAVSPQAVSALAVLAAAPGIRIPGACLIRWLTPGAGGAEPAGRTLRQLAACGLVVSSGGWLMVPSAFAQDITRALPDIDTPFLEFIDSMMGPMHASAAAPMERFHVLRAATYYCERWVGVAGHEAHVARLFTTIGAELFATVRRALWMPIVESVERWLGDDGSSPLLAVVGNAYRLADSYGRAERAFGHAIDLADKSRDRLIAQAGLIRLAVQAGGVVRPPRGAGELTLGDGTDRRLDQARADLLNQQGNIAFRSGEIDSARGCYLEAKSLLSVADITSAVLAVDIEKGLGDVALHLDRPKEAEGHVSTAFRMIANYGMMRLGRVPVAKLLQFAGDIARRRAVPVSGPASGKNARSISAANYWYTRAYQEYANQGLDLGALITSFKSTELVALQGDTRRAFATHLELSEMFAQLDNRLWEYRAKVAALKAHSGPASESDRLLAGSCRVAVAHRLASGEVSLFDRLWGMIAFLASAEETDERWTETAALARRLGFERITACLTRHEIGNWSYAYY